MGSGTGPAGGYVVVLRGGVLLCVETAVVAALLARAVSLDDAGLEETPLPGAARAAPPVVAATLELRHPSRVTRMASRYVRRRLDGSTSTLVLRSQAQWSASGTALLRAVAPLPVAEVAVGATFDLVVPVGEPGRPRYASPVVTLVVAPWLAPALVAQRLVEHRAFLGADHCEGDVALVGMAEAGRASPAQLAEALAAHEATVVLEMLQDVVRLPS